MQQKKTINFPKEKGSENPADLLTKNVPRELLEKFTAMLGVDLVTEANKEGYDIAAVNGGEHQDLVAEEIARCSAGAAFMLLKQGLMDVKVWARSGTRTVCLQGTGKHGPPAAEVVQRRTYNKMTGELVLVDRGAKSEKFQFAQRVPEACCDDHGFALQRQQRRQARMSS